MKQAQNNVSGNMYRLYDLCSDEKNWNHEEALVKVKFSVRIESSIIAENLLGSRSNRTITPYLDQLTCTSN
mgnify:CR=1 FL=1